MFHISLKPAAVKGAATAAIVLLCTAFVGTGAASAARCPAVGTKADDVLGVSRVVKLDTSKGQLYGSVQYKANSDLLKAGEVVLTFDDGPLPGNTRPILDALDKECTKATFFSVGRMAVAFPQTTKEILRRGHTLGTHTWSHPQGLGRIGRQTSIAQIEDGFSAVQHAAGTEIAPFFRFPYLVDPNSMVDYLKGRDVGIFSIDIDSGDTRGIAATSRYIIDRTMRRLKEEGKGILLFHDIKKTTAAAIPELLRRIRKEGYKVVHIVPGSAFKSLPEVDARIKKRYPLANKEPEAKAPPALPVRKNSAAVKDPSGIFSFLPGRSGAPEAMTAKQRAETAYPGRPAPGARSLAATSASGLEKNKGEDEPDGIDAALPAKRPEHESEGTATRSRSNETAAVQVQAPASDQVQEPARRGVTGAYTPPLPQAVRPLRIAHRNKRKGGDDWRRSLSRTE